MAEKRILIQLDEAIGELMGQADYHDDEREVVEAAMKDFIEKCIDSIVSDPAYYTDHPNSPFRWIWDKALEEAQKKVSAQ